MLAFKSLSAMLFSAYHTYQMLVSVLLCCRHQQQTNKLKNIMYALFIAGTVENKCVMFFSILLQLHKSHFWALSHSWMLVAKTTFYWYSNRNVCIPNSNTLAGLVSSVWFFFKHDGTDRASYLLSLSKTNVLTFSGTSRNCWG